VTLHATTAALVVDKDWARAHPSLVRVARSRRRSLRKIAEELADAGHLNERGRPYNAMSISRMLRN